jgi:hypothetical protein
MRQAGVRDVHLLEVRREAQPIQLERFVGQSFHLACPVDIDDEVEFRQLLDRQVTA